MATFYNESWFWALFFTAMSTLGSSLGAIFLKELLTARAQERLERLRMYEKDQFAAYKLLNEFISRASDIIYPPGEPTETFFAVMNPTYFKDIKPNMLLFPLEIRQLLQKFEIQYTCMRSDELCPHIPFKDFMDTHLYKDVEQLQAKVEKWADKVIHKR